MTTEQIQEEAVGAYLKKHPHGAVEHVEGPFSDLGRPYFLIYDAERGTGAVRFYFDPERQPDIAGVASVKGFRRNVLVALLEGWSSYDHFFGQVWRAAQDFLEENRARNFPNAKRLEKEMREFVAERVGARRPMYRVEVLS